MKQVRLLLWLLITVVILGTAAIVLFRGAPTRRADSIPATAQAGFGGPFTLVGSDGRPFSSAALSGKPYAMYFGFTRCGDVCPTTLSRMVKLRQQAGGESAFAILFVTIDPAHDGPRDVGQYADLFNSPIIGLTGTPAQIDHVKKQFGIYAEPVPHAPMGQQMEHSAIVLLFDRTGKFKGTISPDEPDSAALGKLENLVA